jgi:exodeoxyribonuclease V alpha subunit
MSNSEALLAPWMKPGLLSSRHVAGASVLMDLAYGDKSASRDVAEWLIVALLLKTPEDEHTCLNLAEIDAYQPDGSEENEWAPLPFVDLAKWRKVVLGMPELVAVADGTKLIERPLVLAGNRLYLARMYGDEVYVAKTMKALNKAGRLSLLFGGPGSGKTTKTAEALVTLLGDKPHDFKVELAAPTGKAAKRMSQVIQRRVKVMRPLKGNDGAIANAVKILKPVKSKTIHKLLKFNPVADERWRINADNPLDCNLLVIDESSMLSLDMLVHVLQALPERASLWLVGDPDQLASVGAGTVFSDIRSIVETAKLNHEKLQGNNRASDDATKLLIQIVQDMSDPRKSTKASGKSSVDKFIDVLSSNQRHGVLEWIPLDDENSAERVNNLLSEVSTVARERILVAGQSDAKQALAQEYESPSSILDQQVLCVHHRGKLGVQSINQRVRHSLRDKAQQQWFVGRPVLVTRNDARTELYNGDTGVIANINGQRVLVLSDAPDLEKPLDLKLVEVSRVTDHALNYAMTVHKSQGSEYRHVIVMFPQKPSRICTREMLYTAISRVRERLTIVGSEAVIRHMLETPIRRATGLPERF